MTCTGSGSIHPGKHNPAITWCSAERPVAGAGMAWKGIFGASGFTYGSAPAGLQDWPTRAPTSFLLPICLCCYFHSTNSKALWRLGEDLESIHLKNPFDLVMLLPDGEPCEPGHSVSVRSPFTPNRVCVSKQEPTLITPLGPPQPANPALKWALSAHSCPAAGAGSLKDLFLRFSVTLFCWG